MKPISIDDLNKYINMIRMFGYDVPIAVSGTEQSGKSSLWLNCVIRKHHIGPNDTAKFTRFLHRNVIFNPADTKKLKNLGYDEDVPIDEAIRVAWRREFYRPENRWILKLFRQIGLFIRPYYLNIPKFWSLDEEYISDRIKVWIHIVAKEVKMIDGKPVPIRFHAVVFKRDYHAYQDDPWMKRDVRRIMKEERMKHAPLIDLMPANVDTVINRYSKLPSFHAYLSYEPIAPKLWEIYRTFSKEKKLEAEVGGHEDYGKDKLRYYAILYNLRKMGLTQEALSSLTSIDGIPLVDPSWISKVWREIEWAVHNPDKIQELQKFKYKKKKIPPTIPSVS